ncbi:hypothetical protein CH305_05175 [Rhodococcus sp. 15-649-2-2]|nr:hypothetical protein CH305_05175 [Rhodococcus sp. 15-649-2-2]
MFCSRVAVAATFLAATALSSVYQPASAAPVPEMSIWNADATIPDSWSSSTARGDSFVGTHPSVSTRTIIGTDDRVRTPSPSSFPSRTTAFVVATDAAGQQRSCTGFLYGPRSLATSAHCLLSESGWNSDFEIFPAVDGGASPFGRCGWVKASVHPQFSADRSTRFDLGALQLDCSVGDPIGWLRPGSSLDPLPVGEGLASTGYPLDKFPSFMWTARGSVTSVSEDTVAYDLDTAEGQSGSPVVANSDPTTAIAVHSSGFAAFNAGTSLVPAQSERLLRWSETLPAAEAVTPFGSS